MSIIPPQHKNDNSFIFQRKGWKLNSFIQQLLRVMICPYLSKIKNKKITRKQARRQPQRQVGIITSSKLARNLFITRKNHEHYYHYHTCLLLDWQAKNQQENNALQKQWLGLGWYDYLDQTILNQLTKTDPYPACFCSSSSLP